MMKCLFKYYLEQRKLAKIGYEVFKSSFGQTKNNILKIII